MLDDLAFKYGTDKTQRIKHPFTIWYEQEFAMIRGKVHKVLEIGIGEDTPVTKSGASLRMWKEYFWNAQIYGMDINSKLLFFEKRIITIAGDSRLKADVDRTLEITGTDLDLVIDDGDHQPEAQYAAAFYIVPRLTGKFTYVIEDAGNVDLTTLCKMLENKFRVFRWRNWDKSRHQFHDDRLVVVRPND